MHAYTVTSKPGRVRRIARRVWACLLHVAAVALCLLLGAIVLVIRIVRPLVHLAAELAVRCEIEASLRTGMPVWAASAGRRLADALKDEFHAGWRDATTGTHHHTEGHRR